MMDGVREALCPPGDDMPAIAVNEANSCVNPLVAFAYQVNGRLTDITTLSFQIRDLSVAPVVEVVPTTVVNVAACPAGSRLSLGRYVAPFTATAWNLGTHEILWTYTVAAGGPARVMRRRFEVVDPLEWATGASFLSYLDSAAALARGITIPVGGTIANVQRALDEASHLVETYTGRYFEPRYETIFLSSQGERELNIGIPIIGIQEVGVRGLNSLDTEVRELVDLDLLAIHNRHLRGVLNPDDRDNALLSYELEVNPLTTATVDMLRFNKGKHNIDVVGMFGYTDPDNTAVGRTPSLLQRAVTMLAYRRLQDPLGDNAFTDLGRIRSYRTRDQSVSFFGASETGTPSGATGDAQIDAILGQFRRPPQFLVTGTTYAD